MCTSTLQADIDGALRVILHLNPNALWWLKHTYCSVLMLAWFFITEALDLES